MRTAIPFVYPGIQDLTAWVDFSAVAGAAVASGFDVAGYLAQAQFLLGGGLEQEMAGIRVILPLDQQLALSGQVKTLTLPGEMGREFQMYGTQPRRRRATRGISSG